MDNINEIIETIATRDPDDKAIDSRPISYYEIKGVRVPYYAIGARNVLMKDGNLVRVEIVPAFINNLEDFDRNHRLQTFKTAHAAAKRYVLNSLTYRMGYKVQAEERMLAVSAFVPHGMIAMDFERIYINEIEGAARALDSDGDSGRLTVVDRRKGKAKKLTKFGQLAKYPIHTPPIAREMTSVPVDVFSDLTADDIAWGLAQCQVTHDIEEQFRKGHRPNQTGIITSAWDNYELFKYGQVPAVENGVWPKPEEILEQTHVDPGRIASIEGMLKDATKDDGFAAEGVNIMTHFNRRVTEKYRWALTSTGSIYSIPREELTWVTSKNLPEVLDKIWKLQPKFEFLRKPKAGKKDVKTLMPAKKKYETNSKLLYRLLPKEFTINGKPVKNPAGLGIIQFVEFPHSNPDLPWCIQIWLNNEHGPCAMVDTRRGDTLNHAFLVSPIWYPEAPTYDSNGVKTGVEARFVHPIEHLGFELESFDSIIRGGDVEYGRWPRKMADLSNPKYRWKTANLQTKITTWASQAGEDRVPAQNKNGQIEVTDIALWYVRHQVYIDYSRELTLEGKWAMVNQANKVVRLARASAKDSNGKFLLGRDNDTPLTAAPTDHPRRAGQIRSQVVRGLLTATMRTAIISPLKESGVIVGTRTQCYICPSGIEKQKCNAYLSRISADEDDVFSERVEYWVLNGERHVMYKAPARNSAEIGKLDDVHGNKFVSRRHTQVVAEDGDTIDLMIPFTELVAKGNLEYFVQNAEWKTIIVNGEPIRALVGDFVFIRTGAASENIAPRTVVQVHRGLAGMKFRHEASKIGLSWPASMWKDENNLDLSFELELLEAFEKLSRMMPSDSGELD